MATDEAGMREALEEERVFVARGPVEIYDIEARRVRTAKHTLAKIDAALSTAPIPMSEVERISLENGGDPC